MLNDPSMVYAVEASARRRLRMVDSQLRARGITDERVLRAMGSVPREQFVLEAHFGDAYHDCALPIASGQTISQPYMVARAIELARLRGGERVLEVGAGSGYQAAVLAQLAAEVVTIERIPSLAESAWEVLHAMGIENVQVVVGDGTMGWPDRAPYDCILVAAGASRVPPALFEQLREGGRLVIPLGDRDLQRLCAIEKRGEHVVSDEHDACVYVPLIGGDAWPKTPQKGTRIAT
jgi:protein-L-isoaspartate(D-aspartate) O-methyltransferase